MALTLREALKIGGLQQAVVVAGHSGLDNVISCVDILEVPDSSGWLRSNELVVTTCYAVKDNPEAQLNILKLMDQVGSSALAVKFGRFLGSVPTQMKQLADELDIPLLHIPDHISFMDITLPVMTAIVDEQALQLQYSEEVRRKMIQVTLGASSLAVVAKTLSELIDHDTMICNEELQCLAKAGRDCLSQYRFHSETIAQLQQTNSSNKMIIWDIENRQTFEAFPINVRQRRYGYVLVCIETPLTDLHHIAIEHAITLAALQMVKEEAVLQAKKSHCRDLLEDLISGAFKSKELAVSRAEALNISLNKPQVVLIVDIDNFAGYIMRQSMEYEANAAELKNQLVHIVNNCVQQFDWRALVVQRSDSVVVIMPASLTETLRPNHSAMRSMLQQLAQNIQTKVREQLNDITVSIGISSVAHDPLEIAPKYQEVRNVIKLTRKIQGEGTIAFWEDVEIYSLLEQLGQPMERFYEAKLGALDRPDIKNRQVLITTLKVYLECQGNCVETAEKLFIHRNTLRYRLQRIEDILERNLSQPDERFALWLALKVRSLMQVQQ
ncbi:Purine catabolism regulatory protein [Sporomusa carbonis]